MEEESVDTDGAEVCTFTIDVSREGVGTECSDTGDGTDVELEVGLLFLDVEFNISNKTEPVKNVYEKLDD